GNDRAWLSQPSLKPDGDAREEIAGVVNVADLVVVRVSERCDAVEGIVGEARFVRNQNHLTLSPNGREGKELRIGDAFDDELDAATGVVAVVLLAREVLHPAKHPLGVVRRGGRAVANGDVWIRRV